MNKAKKILHTVNSSFLILWRYQKKTWSEYKLVEQNTDPAVQQQIYKSNIHRILPFSILIFVLYLINFLVDLFFIENNSHILLMTIMTILLGIGTLWLMVNISTIFEQQTIKNLKKYKRLFYGFLAMVTIYILVFTYIDVVKRHDLNNYFIFLTIMALYPLFKRKEIIAFTMMPTILVILFIIVNNFSIILINQVIISYILCIFISQTLYTSYKKNKISEKQLSVMNENLLSQIGEDCLTKLLNRTGLQEKLDILWPKAIKEKKYMSTLLIDIDFFKDYNDTFGHQQGDECLINIAKAIQETVRGDTDIACRFGGEEFLVFLYNTSSDKTAEVAKRILKNVEELHFEAANKKVSPYVTVSIGIARMLPTSNEDIEMLIHKADEELYRAKRKGRNCIGSHRQIIS